MKLYIAEKIQPHLDKKVLILKLEDQHNCGVASLTSWPHLGDPSLTDLQKDLVSDQNYSLVQKALYFATKDLKQENIHSLKLPESHKLVQDEKHLEDSLRFPKIKLKPKQSFQILAATLNTLPFTSKSLRLDFNNKLSYDEFNKFLKLCSAETRTAFDFIEDPFDYNEGLWTNIKTNFPELSLALDHKIDFKNPCFDVYIWKPAKSFFPNLSCKVIPTHYMSDEMEWYCALWEASQHDLLNQICGFGTEHLNLTYKAGDKIEIKKHWNQNINDLNWKLLSEDFKLAFNFA